MSDLTSHTTFNKSEFEKLFKSHYSYLCNFAQQYVNDMDTAQDICQKVFITLWEKRANLDPKQSIKSYLFTAVKNRCLNHIRDHKKYRSRVLDLDCGDIDIAAAAVELDDAQALKEKIEQILNSLPEKCKMVFEMSRYQGMKYREIAEELDIAQKTVEAHMSKAMKILRAELKGFLEILILILINY